VTEEVPRSGHYPSSLPKVSVKKPKKQIILSQSMVIDMDPNKVRRHYNKPVIERVFLTSVHRKATGQKL
jgi:hypothetical protein